MSPWYNKCASSILVNKQFWGTVDSTSDENAFVCADVGTNKSGYAISSTTHIFKFSNA